MWSIRTACCSTGDCDTSTSRGNGPISLKAEHPDVISACSLNGASSAGAAACLCRLAHAPGGTSSSPWSPPPACIPACCLSGQRSLVESPEPFRFLSASALYSPRKRLLVSPWLTRTGTSSCGTPTRFCRRLCGLPQAGNQPGGGASRGSCVCCGVRNQSRSRDAMVFPLQAHAQRALEHGGARVKDLEKATAPPPLPADEADVSVCTCALV